MKAKDLMIGDWVNVVVKWKPEVKYMQGKVSELLAEDGWLRVLQTYNPHEDNPVYCICDTQGIPLTPEILEKNGFERLKETRVNCYDLQQDKASIYLEEKDPIEHEWLCIIGRYYPTSWGCRIEMRVHKVHELQHALRLFDIEKEIQL